MTRRAASFLRGETPTVPELDNAPELAVLAVLLAVIDIAGDALLAAHPDLADHDRPYWFPTPAAIVHAHRLLRCSASLRRAVHRYRVAVAAPPATDEPASGDDGIPF
jgi:hypothetical protein